VQLEEHERAYLDGAVDAIVTFEPRRTHLLGKGARPLFDSSAIPGEIVDVLITRSRVMEANKPALQALVDGWFRARDFLRTQPGQAAALAAERERLQPDEFLAALSGMDLPDRDANLKLLGASDANLERSLSRLAVVMTQHKLLSHGIDAKRLLDDRFVRAAAP
jgi:NitT/TauT family transport system substrate-binding protein